MRARTLAVIGLAAAVVAVGALLLREADQASDAAGPREPVAAEAPRKDEVGARPARDVAPPSAPVLRRERAPIAEPPPPPPPPRLPRPPAVQPGFELTRTGLQVKDDVVGTGPMPRPGQTVVVHYTGWLDAGGKNGAQFDSSRDRGEPIGIPFGKGMVIPGWEEGLSTMQAGGKRTLVIPASLAYGDHGSGDVIPPGATLRYEIELVEIKDAAPP